MKQATHFVVQPGWRLLLADVGLDSARVLRHASLPADLFSRQDAAITAAQLFELWLAIEQVGGHEMCLPLKLGQAISIEAFDPSIFACLCSQNLNVAFQRLAVFKRLVGPITLVVQVSANRTSVTLECNTDSGPIPNTMAAAETVFVTQLVRIATRYRVVPKEITLPELPDQIESYREYFGVMPKRGKSISVTFSKEDGVRQFLTANDSMWTFFEVGLRERLTTLDYTASMSDRVKAALLEGLPSGHYAVDDVAKQLVISKRTLQRQLSEESRSFKDILNVTRQQLAAHYLRKPAISQGEIAYLLGFQDVNSFTRAFKGWQGVTPGAYRRKVQNSSAVTLNDHADP